MSAERQEFNVPEDLLWALADNAQAQAAFDKLPQSHRKEYVDWIQSAKKDETRVRRIQQAVEMIRTGKKRA